MCRILIVDDDPHVVQGLLWPLRLRGYVVETCALAESAVEMFGVVPFDLIITDVQLPGMSGLELMTAAAACDPAPHVIVITGFGSPQVEQQACREADAYLTKPFSTQTLLETVERVLSGPRASEKETDV